MFKNLKQITGFLLVLIVAFCVFVQDKLNCPKITEDQRPALVFVEGPVDKSSLCVAYFDGQTLTKKKIISAKYIQVKQLDNNIFLVTAQDTPRTGNVYVIDLSRGVTKLLAKSTRIHCLRAEPRRKRVMLVESNMAVGEVHLIELNLVSFETMSRHTLRRDLLGDRFSGIGPRMKLSPDFKHIAYVSNECDKISRFSSAYTLRILDLYTMKAEELVTNVGVEISGLSSSIGLGIPPFEWISNDEILYKDMPGALAGSSSRALCIFKRVNTKTRKVSEVLRDKLPLTLDGGSLRTNPLNGQLIYNNEYILDLENKRLIPRNRPFAVVPGLHRAPTRIFNGIDVLYSGSARCVATCVSASGRSFAYSLRDKGVALDVTLWAKIEDRDEPIKIAEGPYWPTRLIGWIE